MHFLADRIGVGRETHVFFERKTLRQKSRIFKSFLNTKNGTFPRPPPFFFLNPLRKIICTQRFRFQTHALFQSRKNIIPLIKVALSGTVVNLNLQTYKIEAALKYALVGLNPPNISVYIIVNI